jgi:hypothetical protein
VRSRGCDASSKQGNEPEPGQARLAAQGQTSGRIARPSHGSLDVTSRAAYEALRCGLAPGCGQKLLEVRLGDPVEAGCRPAEAADGEYLAVDAECDVRAPGQLLLDLGEGEADPADILEARRQGVSWLSIWARWSRPEKST